MSINHTHFPAKFVSYETNRITCDYANEEKFFKAMDAFEREGFDTSEFYVLHGQEGIEALDPDGHEHGLWARISRIMHFMISEAEEHSIEDLVADLEKGMIHIGVPASKEQVRDHAHSIMTMTGGSKIVYFDRFYVETFESAS